MQLLKFREDFITHFLGLNNSVDLIAPVPSGFSNALCTQLSGTNKQTLLPSPSPLLPEISRLPLRSSAACARLMEPNPLTTRVPLENFLYLEKVPPTAKKASPAKPCRVCTKNKKRKESTFVCVVFIDRITIKIFQSVFQLKS